MAVGLRNLSRCFYVVNFLNKGHSDDVDSVLHSELDVFLVITCYGGGPGSFSLENYSFFFGQIAPPDKTSFLFVSLCLLGFDSDSSLSAGYCIAPLFRLWEVG